MADVLVAVPMLGRPHAAAPLVASLAASDPDGLCSPLFLCSPGDDATHAACVATGAPVCVVPWEAGHGDYARKMNHAAGLLGDHTWLFNGASDLAFRPGWLERALAKHGTRPPGVIGTNDLGNSLVKQGRHSTHSLIHRDYLPVAVIDEPGAAFSTAYDHNFCDVELVEYARWNGRFVAARDSVVEHLHPHWRKAENDGTYDKGQQHFRQDQLLIFERRKLWAGATPRERARARRARLRPPGVA